MAVAGIKVDAEAIIDEGRRDAERLRERAAELEKTAQRRAAGKLQEIGPHLKALLGLGRSVPEVAALCEVSHAEVRAARSGQNPATVKPAGPDESQEPAPAAHSDATGEIRDAPAAAASGAGD